jgi:hypothetical protein
MNYQKGPSPLSPADREINLPPHFCLPLKRTMNPIRSYLARAFLATELTDGDGRVELPRVTRVFRLRLELCLAGGARQGHLNTVHYSKNDNLEYTSVPYDSKGKIKAEN